MASDPLREQGGNDKHRYVSHAGNQSSASAPTRGLSVTSHPTPLEAAVRSYAASRRLRAGLEARWLAWASADAAAMLELAEALRLGGNQIADVMTWLEDIASRDSTSPARLLGAAEIRGILSASLGRGDKLKRVKAVLRKRRYPRLTALEKALDDEVQALRLGSNVEIRFPPGLEGDEVTVEVRARHPEALREALGRLGAAVAEGRFERMFQLLDEVL
jgi:hypothetical protein